MVKWKGRVSAVILSAALVISNLNMTNVNASETPETVEQSTETDTSADTEKLEEEQEDEKTDSSSDETKGTGSAEEENTADNTEPGTNDPADTENTGENNGSADGSGSENSGEENNTEDKDDTDAEKEDDDKEGNSSEEDKTDVLTLPVQTVVSEEGKAVVNVPESVKEGDTFTVEASEGYAVKEVKVNGETVQAEDGVYTIANLSEEMTQVVIEVSVEAVTEENVSEQIRVSYTVTPENGAIVEGPQEVKKGEGFEFQVTAAEGYEITAVKNADTVLEPVASEEKVVEEAVSANDTSAAAQTVFTYHVDGTEEDVTISVEAKNLNETEETEEMLTFTGETTIGGVKAEVTVKTDDQTLKDASLVLGEEVKTDTEKLNEYVQALEGDVEYSVAEEMPFDMHFEVKAEDSDEMVEKEPAADSKMEISISFKEGALTFGEDVDRVDLVHYEENNDVVEKVESIVSNVADNSQVSVLSENTQLTYSEVSFEWNEFSTLSFVGLSEAETKTEDSDYTETPKYHVDYKKQSEGITTDVVRNGENNYSITLTINEGVTGDLVLDLSEGVMQAGSQDSQMPGDTMRFDYTIINHSGRQYQYKDGSFVLAPMQINPDDFHMHPTAVGMDGQRLPMSFCASRYGNDAIAALYNKSEGSITLDDLMGVENKLAEEGYHGKIYTGEHALADYYLDYYNEKNGTDYDNLRDLAEANETGMGIDKAPTYTITMNEYNALCEKYGPDYVDTYLECSGSGNNIKCKFKEPDSELAALSYDMWWIKYVGMSYGEEATEDFTSEASMNQKPAEYGVERYLAKNEKWQNANSYFGGMNFNSGNEIIVPGAMGLSVQMPSAYMGYSFGIYSVIELQDVTPTPPVDPNPDPDPDEPEGGGGGTTTPPTETPAVLGERVPETGVLGERVEQPTEEQGVLGERRGAATADNTPIGAWAVIAVMAAGGLTAYGYRRKKDIK